MRHRSDESEFVRAVNGSAAHRIVLDFRLYDDDDSAHSSPTIQRKISHPQGYTDRSVHVSRPPSGRLLDKQVSFGLIRSYENILKFRSICAEQRTFHAVKISVSNCN